jgi:hypothetical protein
MKSINAIIIKNSFNASKFNDIITVLGDKISLRSMGKTQMLLSDDAKLACSEYRKQFLIIA